MRDYEPHSCPPKPWTSGFEKQQNLKEELEVGFDKHFEKHLAATTEPRICYTPLDMDSSQQKTRRRHKIIVGIDYGTTFSGM